MEKIEREKKKCTNYSNYILNGGTCMSKVSLNPYLSDLQTVRKVNL